MDEFKGYTVPSPNYKYGNVYLPLKLGKSFQPDSDEWTEILNSLADDGSSCKMLCQNIDSPYHEGVIMCFGDDDFKRRIVALWNIAVGVPTECFPEP